ncbi:tubulin epsilon and delta complex protein 1-like [Ptychodera flava]|uniref:tubulin epsilon and delta complex protein 1-like n=1 Tax=Ptychodera flava TaxID=63121 RepID=UPI003969EE1F
MAMIRENLELLSRGLTASGTSKITAERFRQAKFNKNEAVKPFWILLYELLLYRCKHEFPAEHEVQSLPIQDIVQHVKHHLYSCGYRSSLLRTSTTLDDCCSRELLLSFGWIVAKCNIIDELMENCQAPLDKFHDSFRSDHDKYVGSGKQPNLSLQNGSDFGQCAKHLLWLNGRTQMNLRGLYSMEVEKQKTNHHVHRATQGVSVSTPFLHLSAQETYLLRYPQQLKKFYDFLEAESNRLQSLMKWKENEDVFWKWMDSVLEVKLQETGLTHQRRDDVAPDNVSVATDTLSCQLMDLNVDLEMALKSCHGNMLIMEGMARNKISSVSKKQFIDYSVKEVELDVVDTLGQFVKTKVKPKELNIDHKCLLRNTLASPNKQKIYKELEKKNTAKDIKLEIDQMRQVRDELEMELETLRNKHGQVLSSLVENLDNVVCIPPLS